jgi:hypothetical protein
MKRILWTTFCLLWAGSLAFAQEATIIEIKGKVFVKRHDYEKWTEAKLNMALSTEASIETKGNGTCTIAFDEKKHTILTVKPKTTVRLERILPGNVFLSKGRVFSLIKSGSSDKKFEVKTPTAIAGARGTGWETEFQNGETLISCFDDTVYVASLNEEGNITDTLDLKEGFEIEVRDEIDTSDLKQIPENEKGEWQEFAKNVEIIIGENLLEPEQKSPAFDGHNPNQAPNPPMGGEHSAPGHPEGHHPPGEGFDPRMNEGQYPPAPDGLEGQHPPPPMEDFEGQYPPPPENFNPNMEGEYPPPPPDGFDPEFEGDYPPPPDGLNGDYPDDPFGGFENDPNFEGFEPPPPPPEDFHNNLEDKKDESIFFPPPEEGEPHNTSTGS